MDAADRRSRILMRRLLIVLVCLAALVGVGFWVEHHRATQTGPQAASTESGGAQGGRRGGGRRGGGAGQAVPVLVAKSQKQDVPIYLDGLGTVQAFYTVTVHSMIDGPLVDVRFTEGQDVKTGDVLARIDARPYQAALDQAVAKKAQDDANLANARLDLARYQKLAQTNYTTQQQADTQKATVAMDEAIVKQDQAAIDTARTNLSYTTISSPIDGRTGIRNVDPGNIIHTSDTNGLVVITQLHPISVIFTLPQQFLGDVRAAMQNGPAQVDALPQGSTDQPAATDDNSAGPGLTTAAADPSGDPPPPVVLDHGSVSILDNQVDSTTGTIRLKATFQNPDLKLWPGGFINVRLLARTVKGAITVPPAAVQRGPQGAYVYVIGSDNKAKRQNVTVGHTDEDVAIVTAGLQDGATVVTDGASRLTDGAQVTISQPGAQNGTQPASQGQRNQAQAPGTQGGGQHRRRNAS
jgi:membrane fusion protein, multidrug efflux system